MIRSLDAYYYVSRYLCAISQIDIRLPHRIGRKKTHPGYDILLLSPRSEILFSHIVLQHTIQRRNCYRHNARVFLGSSKVQRESDSIITLSGYFLATNVPVHYYRWRDAPANIQALLGSCSTHRRSCGTAPPLVTTRDFLRRSNFHFMTR